MPSVWQSFLPAHFAQDLLLHPDADPLQRAMHFEAAGLYAGISGFTAMADALGQAGPAGAAELAAILNSFFNPMIALIESWGGIVGKFGSQALPVIFPAPAVRRQEVARQALQCALQMQAAMPRYASIPTSAGTFALTLKAGLAIGPVDCSIAGSPDTHLEYLIAGDVVDLCRQAAHLAGRGEVLVHPGLIDLAGPLDTLAARQGYGLVGQAPEVWPPSYRRVLPSANLPRAVVKTMAAFLPSCAAERLQNGQEAFDNAYVQVTVLAGGFSEPDSDPAIPLGRRLKPYLGQVIETAARYEGCVINVDLSGSGGQYLIAFGAPLAHPDVAEQAVRCARDLRRLPGASLRLGIHSGPAFCGQVGSETRREYAVIGETVDLAEHLMQAAQPGQIIVSQAAQARLGQDGFAWEVCQAVQVDGNGEAIFASALVGA